LKKYFTPLNIILVLEAISAFLTALGLIPREAILVWTGVAIFYMIFSPVEDSLWLAVASIPLFAALPISENFDSMATWRILVAVLFSVWFFKRNIFTQIKQFNFGKILTKEYFKQNAISYLTVLFLFIGALSVIAAGYKLLAIKKLLFLINIFLLFLVVRDLGKTRESIVRIWQAAATGGAIVLAVALAQFTAVLLVPLFSFWQFWAEKVIVAFYGQNLAHLLSRSNTWFAYYASNPPALRLFSVFPDSHSFAMFCMMLVPILLGLVLYFEKQKKQRILFWSLAVLALGGIVLSGSRGTWLSIVPVILCAIYLYGKRIEPLLVKKVLSGFAVFIVLFVVSAGYPPLLYKFQSWQTGENASTTFSFFERARSISDAEEISNKGRMEIWLASLKSISQRPIIGVGLGNYVKVLGQDASAAKQGASAHNLYLDFASEIGIIGVLILVAIFVNILYTSWAVFRRSDANYAKLYGLVFGLYFLWISAYSFFDVVLLNDKVLLFLMVTLAALYSLKTLMKVNNS